MSGRWAGLGVREDGVSAGAACGRAEEREAKSSAGPADFADIQIPGLLFSLWQILIQVVFPVDFGSPQVFSDSC